MNFDFFTSISRWISISSTISPFPSILMDFSQGSSRFDDPFFFLVLFFANVERRLWTSSILDRQKKKKERKRKKKGIETKAHLDEAVDAEQVDDAADVVLEERQLGEGRRLL